MKPIQIYSPESIDKLKQWITEMNATGDTKYYEIFVDGMRIVHKTNDAKEFDRHKVWIGSETQQIKVLTYNTIGSHRSKVFEFRTAKYPQEINYKEFAETLQRKNEELNKRIADAEVYIAKLENEATTQNKGTGADFQTFITLIKPFVKNHPQIKNFGLEGLFTEEPVEETKATEETECTFKKRKSGDTFQGHNQESQTTTEGISKDHSEKLFELNAFFKENPDYINVVHELTSAEKVKNAT